MTMVLGRNEVGTQAKTMGEKRERARRKHAYVHFERPCELSLRLVVVHCVSHGSGDGDFLVLMGQKVMEEGGLG